MSVQASSRILFTSSGRPGTRGAPTGTPRAGPRRAARPCWCRFRRDTAFAGSAVRQIARSPSRCARRAPRRRAWHGRRRSGRAMRTTTRRTGAAGRRDRSNGDAVVEIRRVADRHRRVDLDVAVGRAALRAGLRCQRRRPRARRSATAAGAPGRSARTRSRTPWSRTARRGSG